MKCQLVKGWIRFEHDTSKDWQEVNAYADAVAMIPRETWKQFLAGR